MFTFIKKVIKTGTATSSYPLEPIAVDKNFRGKPEQNPQQCIGCGRCSESCPSQVIRIEQGKARIRYKHCIRCYCCHEMCPVKAIHIRGRV